MSSREESALDIIYALPEKIQHLLSKIALLENRAIMTENKLNAILSDLNRNTNNHKSGNENPIEEEQSEVMEIRSRAQKKQNEPFNFGKTTDASEKEPPLSEAPPLVIDQPKDNSIGVKIPFRAVDPMPQSAIQTEAPSEKQTSTLIRGRLKERDGGSIAAVDVKIFDNKNIMIKKTKTAATGEWIAMLPPGEYTVEFTKPGQKPLFKPISVISGKKEIEVLI